MSNISVENILSLILVKENIRPAFLFQSTFFSKNNSSVLSELNEIKKMFPELIYSDDYTNYQGTIISKKKYNGRSNITNEEMGKILGYPCYNDFNSLDKSKQYYTIEVVATSINGKKYYILTNVCQNKTKLYEFKTISEKAKQAFAKEKYKQLIGNDTIEKTEVFVIKEIPTQFIINKLVQNKDLSEKEKEKVSNILFNFGFSIQLQLYFTEEFQYNNPVHKGILLSLLLREINDNLTPFFPLQNYPEQDTKVAEITNQFEIDLIAVLKKTAFKSFAKIRTTVKKHA